MIEDHLTEYVDVVEAGRVLGIYPESVKRLIRYGKLAAEKVGNNDSSGAMSCKPTPAP